MTDSELNAIIADYTAFAKALQGLAKAHRHECTGKIELPSIDFVCLELNVSVFSNGEAAGYVCWYEDGTEQEEGNGSPMFALAHTDKLAGMLKRIYDECEDIDMDEVELEELFEQLQAIGEASDVACF